MWDVIINARRSADEAAGRGRPVNALHDVARDPTACVALAAGPEGLAAIRDPGCAGAIWCRPAPPFQAWLEALPPAALPCGREILRPGAVRAAVERFCDGADTPAGPERAALTGDVAALAERFASLVDAPHLRVRLTPVDGDSCRRFHVDAVRARLVCTYRGPGTQYGLVEDGAAPTQIYAAATGAPIVLRGRLWPAPQAPDLVHRSPPIGGTGRTRLVLMLDPVDDPEEEA